MEPHLHNTILYLYGKVLAYRAGTAKHTEKLKAG